MPTLQDMLPRPLRLGVIGAGGVAQSSHLPAVAQLRGAGWPVSVVAVADPDPERITAAAKTAGAENCQAYPNGASLLAAGGVDAVLLLTPPAQTAVLIEDALARGIPALAEKPAGPDARTLARLVDAEKAAANPLVRVAYNRRSLPLAAPFRAHLQEMRNASSETLHVEARLWRAQRSEAIFYDDTMPHALDFLLWCLGPLTVSDVTWWPRSPTTNGLPAGLRVAFQGNNADNRPVTAHLDVRPAVGRDVESYEVMGDKKSLMLTYPAVGAAADAPSELTVYENGTPTRIASPETAVTAISDPRGLTERGFLPQLATFLQLVASGAGKTEENTLCTLAEAHGTALLKEAIKAHAPPP